MICEISHSRAMIATQTVPLVNPKSGKMSGSMTLKNRAVKKSEETESGTVAIVNLENAKNGKLKHFKSAHLLEYHRTFFNLGYFLLIIPFRLVCNEKNGERMFKFHHSRVQQVLCAVLQILVMYEYISSIRLQSLENLDGTPMSYLHVATYVASFVYVMFFIYVFWAKRKLFKRMLESIQNLEFASDPGKYAFIKIRMLAVFFCCFSIMVAMTDPMIHDGFLIRDTPYGTFKKFACRARSYYLFEDCPKVNSSSLLPPNETIMDKLVTVLHLIIYIPNLIMVHIVDVVVVLTTFCMWNILKDFITHSKDEFTSAEQALVHYESLKRLVQSMNSAVGLLTFSAIAISLPFYASWGAIVFNDDSVDWLYLVHVSTYFVNFFTILAFGADFNFKVGEFYGRISVPEVCEQISPNRLTSLLMDMHANQISMRGCGFFVMTYRFFGTILSLIVTYTIIILQFQFSRRSMGQVNCTYFEILNSTSSSSGFTRIPL